MIKFIITVILCLGSGMVLGINASDLVAIYFNGELLELSPPARLENGNSLAPVRPIAEALGAKISWNPELHEIYLERNPWLEVDHEPTFGNTYPFETKALGPILTLRHYLSEKQWESLQNQKPDQPFLARFEIIDARSDINPPGLLEGLPEPSSDDLKHAGFRLAAILYWAYLDSGSGVTAQASVVVREETQTERSIGQLGPSITKVRVDTMRYLVTPNRADRESENRLILGADGWSVQELQPEQVPLRSGEVLPVSRTIDVTKGNVVLPFYDLSALLLQ